LVNKKFLLQNVWHFIALGFGAGLVKKGAGTIGTLITFIYLIPILLLGLKSNYFIFIGLFFMSWFATHQTLKNTSIKDPGFIVIDEIIAYLFILITIPLTIQNIIFSFVIFRFLDIFKPWPINKFEKIKGALGVIADDLVAAFITIAIILGANWI
jgi:phosphatidylglycerophosphatase A